MNYLKTELFGLLKSNEAMFDFIVDSSLDGLWYRNFEQKQDDWVSPQFWTRLGYVPEETADKAHILRERINPEDRKAALDLLARHCEDSKIAYDTVVRWTHKDGSILWFHVRGAAIRDENGKAIRLLAALTDITAERKNAEKLKMQTALLQSSIEAYKDVLVFSIDKNYNYLIFNEAFKLATFQAYGTEVKEGMCLLDSFTNADDRRKSKENCDRALRGDNHVTIEVYGDLERFYFETRYNAIYNAQSEIIGVTILSTNVTERKRHEEQLLELNEELASFSYSVSHDLRAPLRAISGYASILQEDYSEKLDQQAHEVINTICRSAHKMGNLIDDLLAFSQLGRKDLVKTDVNMDALAKVVLKELQEIGLYKNAHVKINTMHPSYGDHALLKQVWTNLISNALKYSSKKKEQHIVIGSNKNDSGITYWIKDNGVGFDMKYYDKLFGVFRRLHTEQEFEGTGVGLAIVHRILTRHGGKLWAESRLDVGSEFFFTLPNK